jgi:ferrous iron transport protein B
MLLANVFFGSRAGSVVFAMYVLSGALVVLVGLVLRGPFFRGEPRDALLLELPPYRRPTLRLIAAQAWQRLAGFLRTAGGIVWSPSRRCGYSWRSRSLGRFRAGQPVRQSVRRREPGGSPVFASGRVWRLACSGALLTGFVAKEAVVSTFAQTYRTESTGPDLSEQLRATFTRTSHGHPGPAVLALMVFLLAYTPCVAAVAAQRAEIGARWTVIGIGLQLGSPGCWPPSSSSSAGCWHESTPARAQRNPRRRRGDEHRRPCPAPEHSAR